MEQGNNWASWKRGWSQMNFVLCQCSSSLRVGGLLACDLFYEVFPSPVHSSSCSLHCFWSCSPGCLTLTLPQIVTNTPPASPYSFLPPYPHEKGGVTRVCLARGKPSAWQVPRAPPALLSVQLPHACSDWPEGAQVVRLGIPTVVWVQWGASPGLPLQVWVRLC